MKNRWILFLVLLALGNCDKEQSLFRRLDKSLTEQWKIRFSEDPLLVYPSKQLQSDLEFLDYAATLVQLTDTSRLNDRQIERYHQLLAQMAAKRSEIIPYRRNPAFYDLGTPVGQLLRDTTLELDSKLDQIHPLLDSLPAFYASARENLNYFSEDRVALTLDLQQTFFLLLRDALTDSIAISGLSEVEKTSLQQKSEQCRLAITDYMAFCRSKLYERNTLAPLE